MSAGRFAGACSVSRHTSLTLRLGLALVLTLAMALPVRIWLPLGAFQSFAPVDALLLMAPLVLAIASRRPWHISVGSRNLFILLLIPLGAYLLSFSWTTDAAETFRGVVLYSEALVAFVVTTTVLGRLRSHQIAKLFFWFVGITIGVSVLSAIRVPIFAPQVPPVLLGKTTPEAFLASYYARLSNPYIGLSNNLASVLAFCPFVLAAYARVTGQTRYKGMAFLALVAVFMTLSRGVILALVLTYALWTCMNCRRAVKNIPRFVIYLTVIVIVVLVFVDLNPTANMYIADRLRVANVDSRLITQLDVMHATLIRPLGYGGGVPIVSIIGGEVTDAHNAYIQQFFYFGILIGLIVNVCLLLLPWATWRWRLASHAAQQMRGGLGYAFVCSLLIFMSEASFEGSILRVLFYYEIGISAALIVALQREYDNSIKTNEAA